MSTPSPDRQIADDTNSEAAPMRAAFAGARGEHWVRRLWPTLRRHRGKFALTLAATVVSQAGLIALPLTQKVIIDDAIVAGNGSLWLWVSVLVAVAAIAAIGTVIRRANGNGFGFAVQHDLRDAVYRHVQRLDVGYRTDDAGRLLSSGEVISRSTADITLVQTLLSQVHVLFGSLLMVTGSLLVMAFLSPLLSLVALACLPLLLIAAVRLRRRVYPAVWADQRAQADTTGIVAESTAGVRIVRAFGQQDREFSRYAAAAKRLFGSRVRTARINAVYTPLMQAVPTLGQLAVLGTGAWLAWNGAITVGTFVAFFSYLVQLAAPVRTLSNALATVNQARAGADRILELLDVNPEVEEAADAEPLAVAGGAISLRNVGFGHRSGKPLLDGLDLDIAVGETVAIVGGAGSGKSTLAQLLVRFFDPETGTVLIDGQDLRAVSLQSLRRAVGIVFEDALLFSGTVAENIAKGRPEATRDDIRRAARIAGADAFISALPLGYDTPVAELGASLSGGQRQRLTIARALLIDPPILILDDATSAVDGRTEAGILDALRDVVRDRTTVLIARRQSSLQLADRVVFLADGKVAASGSHSALLRDNSDYRALVQSTLADDVVAKPVPASPSGIDETAWPVSVPQQAAAGAAVFVESVSAGGFSRQSVFAKAELAGEAADIDAALAKLPPADTDPQVDVAAERDTALPFTLRRFVTPYRAALAVGLVLVVAEALIGLSVPLLIGSGVEAVVSREVGGVIGAAALLALAIAAAYGVGTALLRQTARTGERLLLALRIRIIGQFHRLPLERFESEGTGRLIARATTDVDALATLFQQGLLNAIVGVVTCVGILVGLAVLEPRLALALLPVLPVLVLLTEWYRRRSAAAYEDSRQHVAAVYAGIQEGVTGSRVTRALASEGQMAAAFRQRSHSYRRAREKASRISAIYFPSLQFLTTLAKALVLLAAAGPVARGEIAIGVLVTFLLYLDLFFTPIQQLSQVFDQWLMAGTSLRRIEGLLAEKTVPQASGHGHKAPKLTGALTLSAVSFHYPETSVAALDAVTLEIAAGTTLAVVGATGAGKSTLARVVTGLSAPTEGLVEFDGIALGAIDRAALHSQLAYVPQEPTLFAATVADNIAYGRPDAPPAEIEDAARKAGAHEFVAGLAFGYRTLVSEGGRSLSAGQRQMLCLARALLLNPAILVLDEATARLDLAAEAVIDRALAADRTRTTLIIAHRLETVRRADRVVVIEAGRIVEDGAPSALLLAGGAFARLHGFAAADEPGRSPHTRHSANTLALGDALTP